jgi:hypothetical protein
MKPTLSMTVKAITFAPFAETDARATFQASSRRKFKQQEKNMAGAHDYTRYTQHPDDPFTARVMAIKNDDTSGLEDKFENWNAEQVKEATEGLMRADQQQQVINARVANAEAWMAGHPEYISQPRNNDLMNHELKRMFGEIEWTLDHYDAAFESLCADNFLKLNQVEVEKKRKAAAKQRFEQARSVTPSEDDLYSMDMHELRMRANGVIR